MDFDSLTPDSAPVSSAPQGSFDSMVDDEDKYGGISGSAKAFGAGAARGATFGLSDQAMTRSGLVNPETLKGLEQTNPGSSIAGEIAGVVAPMALGDAAGAANLPGLVSKLGGGVERGVAKLLPQAAVGKLGASIAAKAAGFGTEGAIYGLGQSISENALGDHDLVSQQTLANIGMSAAFAGGLGSLVGAYGGRAASVIADASSPEEKLAAQHAMGALDPASPEGALVGTAGGAKEKLSMLEALRAQKENASEILKAGETLGAPVLPAQTSASKFIQDATSSLSKTPSIPGVITQQAISKGFDAVDTTMKDVLGSAEHLSPYDAGSLIKEQVQKTVDDMYEPLKAGYAERTALGETIQLPDEARLKLWNKLQETAQNTGSVGSEASKLVESYADKALSQNTVKQLDELISEIGEKQTSAYRAGETKNSVALGALKDDLKDFQIREITKQGKELAKSVGPEAEQLAEEAVQKHKEVTKQYAQFKEILSDLGSDQRLGKTKTHGQVGNVLDGIPNEKVLGKMFDPKNADGLARLQKNFPEVFKTLMEQKKSQILQESLVDGRIQVGKVLRQLYDENKMSSKVRGLLFSPQDLEKLNASKTWVESLPKDINPSGTGKALAFHNLITNPFKASAQNFLGYATQKLIDHFAGSPEEASKIMTLANTQKAAQKTSSQVESGISNILGKTARPLAEKAFSKIYDNEDYKKKTDAIKEAANNFGMLHQRIAESTQGIYNHAPNTAGSMQIAMGRAMQFLNSKIPQSAPISMFGENSEPSTAEVSQFKRYYDVVENPLSALKQVKAGDILPETIETLQSVYPQLYQHMQQAMVNQIGEMKNKKSLSYQTKMAISQFMGQPIDSSLNFQSVMNNQQAFQQPAQAPMGQQKPSKTGMQKITLASRTGLGRGPEDT